MLCHCLRPILLNRITARTQRPATRQIRPVAASHPTGCARPPGYILSRRRHEVSRRQKRCARTKHLKGTLWSPFLCLPITCSADKVRRTALRLSSLNYVNPRSSEESMKSGIWQFAGVSLLCLGISAQALADERDESRQNQLYGGSNDNGQQRQQQQNQQRNVERQQQQQRFQEQNNQQRQVQQQQNQLRNVEREQQQQINQQQDNQQRQIQQQQNQQRQVERQQQQQIQQQQLQQRNVERQQQQQIDQQQRDQQRQIQQQQNQQRQQLRQSQDNLPIQSGPREAWQTQQPRQGYYQDIPRGNNRNWQAGNGRPNDRWEGRPDGHGNGWGPGPQYRPGYAIDRVPGGYSRIPYRGQDYFYSGGYWYRPQGPRYVVVTPPYGVRVSRLPSYSQEVWIGSSLLFLAAGTYYAYQPDSQDYVVVNPPQNEAVYQAPAQQQDNGYDPVAYPQNGQSQQQVELDRYQCYRWAAEQSGFDPANITSQPQPEVVDLYRRSMGACLAGRGYSVN
ncbi:Uncharacterized protein ALO40_05180 [Pseudomonas syringae pv. viburni]|uniref:Glycine zipper family protein n=1 Tax=Pseudomonas syringae pv. viburni TaxID=251703 RepID=A0A0N8TE33_9PSED|nr:Uncharacterized protein ALO40_05180 [Pseudomonas syringae pv. viburni]